MLTRKTFIQRSIQLGTGAIIISALPGCSLFDEPEMRVCTAEELKAAGHLILKFNRKKIFVTLENEKPTILSMICRHKRCTVNYETKSEQFLCPCHDSTYDKQGKVLDGPPPGPLYHFKAELRGEEVWVLNEKV